MRAGEAMAGNDEISIAGDVLIGIPAAGGDEAIEDERLECGTGCGKGALGIGEIVRGQEAAGVNVEHENARAGRGLGRVVCRILPGGNGSLRGIGAERGTGEYDGER